MLLNCYLTRASSSLLRHSSTASYPVCVSINEPLHMLQTGVATREVEYEDMMEMTYQVAIHKGSSGSEHGKGGRLVVAIIPQEGNL